MRLGPFRLNRYGPFEQLDLPFDPTPGRVNLIVAPNGYGKSVIRRSIDEFLFGIDSRTPMSFRHGTEKMLLTADVVCDGVTRGMVRRKGNGNTLSLANGGEVPPDEADRLRGGAPHTVFEELFGLDTALLRSGGKDLINSQGRLGQVLFAAGGGLGRIRDLLTELERRRDDLGRANRRHTSRPLWTAFATWEQANTDLRKSALRPADFTAMEKAAAEAAKQLHDLLAEQSADATERDRLRTVAACRPWLERLAAARSVLETAADVPDVDETFERRWRDALEEGAKSASAAATANAELLAARTARDGLSFDPAWLGVAADIAALADQRGLALGAETDLPRVQRDRDADQAMATASRQTLGWDATVPLPATAVVRDAQKRLQVHPKLAANAANAAERMAEAERHLAATTADLEALPDTGDVTALADLLAGLRAAGDPAARLDTAARKRREAEAALRAALAAIPDCPLPEAALGTTAAPSETKLTAADKALSQAERAHDAALRDHARRADAIKAEQIRLDSLERTAMLPAPGALTKARADRDTLWGRFCVDPSALGIAVAVERAIREADAVADALIRHGQEVAEAASLRTRLETLAAEHQADETALSRAAEAVAAARTNILAIARAAGGNMDDVATLRAFLRARETAVNARMARQAAADDLAATEQHLLGLGARLAAAMGLPMPALPMLGTVLAEADRRIEADRMLASRRQTLTDQAAKCRTARATAQSAAAADHRALADWAEQWAPVARALARPDGESQAETADALGRIEELRAAEKRIADATRRIEDMQAAIASLATQITRLSPLSPAIAALPPTEAAAAFQQAFQKHQSDALRCQDADKRIEQASKRAASAAAAAEASAATLKGLRAAIRVDTDEAAEHQLVRIRAVVAARANESDALRQLAQLSGGVGLDALQTRAAETTADADNARIAEIDARHHERLPRIEAARETNTTASAALERAGAGTDAAEAAQRREAAQAMLSRTVEEALVLHAQHALLQAALDRQAAGASQPLLIRISEVFRTITGGAQAGVRIEDSRDGQTMVALEADGVTRKSLDQLSEGTCDQLYLALRIAALEDYAANTAPLPFIADDILQTFDDPRTEATLRALLELSERVQVIVLTHHTHVGDLAARMPDGAVRVIRPDQNAFAPAGGFRADALV